ncbi:anti-phage deoxyguanosine triphosphatase [Paenibacillus wenxiniae]|uniref:Deoxyguanosinetriphosphate triphosphohydrolase-like protein n=1 Tax=Paenibacillus wenxiniae TaxID=1636843 RepID=A0ABW4RL02_9BACL
MIQSKMPDNKLYNAQDKERQQPQSPRTKDQSRDEFERDYGRIVHSAAFRRLQSKTQVIGVGESDFPRTRLTHSMEVAQIARGIASSLNSKNKLLIESDQKIDSSLIEAAALAHDFGHPPFGHQGERALNEMMHNVAKSGFEGNAQTFRILTSLERGRGLNLTRATLLAILKYPIRFDKAVNYDVYEDKSFGYKPPKSSVYVEDQEVFDWLIKPMNSNEQAFYLSTHHKNINEHKKTIYKTLECSIIELADDIAYATHDLEDAIRLKFIKNEEIISILEKYHTDTTLKKIKEKLEKKAVGHESDKIKDIIADLISIFISNVDLNSRNSLNNKRLHYHAFLPEPLKELIKNFTNLVYDKVISLQRVQTIEWKGGNIIKEMFGAFYDTPKLLSSEDQSLIEKGSESTKARIICDYLAGMTDSYALRMYSRLFEGRESRLFDI